MECVSPGVVLTESVGAVLHIHLKISFDNNSHKPLSHDELSHGSAHLHSGK